MYRSYRVIMQGKQGQTFVMASSAKEASEIAAQAMRGGEQVIVEDPEHQVVSIEQLAEIIRNGELARDGQ